MFRAVLCSSSRGQIVISQHLVSSLSAKGRTVCHFRADRSLMCLFVVPYMYLLYYMCIAVVTLDAGLLARSQYPEGPATGHLDTGFSWFSCIYKRMLRWFPSFQVATTCLSCSPPDLNFLVTPPLHICVRVK